MSGAETLQSENRSVNTIEIPDDHDTYLKTRHDIIYHYKYYIINIYGREAWESLINEYHFNSLFYASVYRYGLAVFQDIVNSTSKNLDISICDILKSFGQYYRDQN